MSWFRGFRFPVEQSKQTSGANATMFIPKAECKQSIVHKPPIDVHASVLHLRPDSNDRREMIGGRGGGEFRNMNSRPTGYLCFAIRVTGGIIIAIVLLIYKTLIGNPKM